jgi:hypothetical protein
MNARTIHVEAPNASTMIRLPDTAGASENCVDTALPNDHYDARDRVHCMDQRERVENGGKPA